jgi:alcohol dehydrogenase/propanol-preferring alcohol dehydrogenase
MGGGREMKITHSGVKLPCAPGHEIAGREVAKAPEATGVAIGDKRIVYPWMGCGKCDLCLSDQENLCYSPNSLGVIQDGGFGTHVVVPNASYLVDYGDLDPALASTFACSGTTVYSAIRKLQPVDKQKPILLVGAGGLGLAAIAVLRALGFEKIIVIDLNAEKRAAALKEGASHAIDGAAERVAEQVAEAAGGLVQAAIDFVNIGETVSVALECLGKSGKLVLVGVGGGDYTLSLAGMIFRPRSIIGSITGSRGDLRAVVALAQAGKLPKVPITRMAKDSANEALDRLKAGTVVGRIVLEQDFAGQ